MPVRSRTDVSAAFAILERCAVAGERCPENGTFGIDHGAVPEMARRGLIRVEISGRNYRTVVMLMGMHAGMRTRPDPAGNKPWKIIDASGLRTIKRVNANMPSSIPHPRKRKLSPRVSV